MGFKSTRKLSNFIIILSLFFLNCTKEIDNSISLNFHIIDQNEYSGDNYYGPVIGFNDDHIIFGFNNRPIYIINLFNNAVKEIGKVGEAPREYLFPSCTAFYNNDMYIYCLSTTKIMIYDSCYNLKNEVKIGSKITNFYIFNDSIIIYIDQIPNENIFVVYDIKNLRKINSFGECIEYPIVNDKNKLYNKGKLKPLFNNINQNDSLLIWYDYYNDKIKVYNIFTGKEIKIFGRVHNKWSVPEIFQTPTDQYHPTSHWRVRMTPCQFIGMSDNYIYIIFCQFWLNGWNVDREILLSDDFVLIDIYNMIDFSYVGSINLSTIPLEDNNILMPYNIDVQNDTILNILFYNPGEGMNFKKITVMVDLTDTITD